MRGRAISGPFDPRLVAGLVAAGLLAFVGYFVLSAYAPNFRSGRDGRAHPLSVSAVGYKGLVDLIALTGGTATLVRDEAMLDSEDLLIVTLNENTKQAALTELLDRRRGKATLLVLPKWLVQPDPLRRGWVHEIGPHLPVSSALPEWLKLSVSRFQPAREPLSGVDFLDGLAVPEPGDVVHTVEGDGLDHLVEGDDHKVVLARVADRGPLYILADPDLINNQGLREPQRARAALMLIEQLNATDAESVMFDLTLSGLGAKPNLLRLAFEPPFLPLTVALLVAGLLAGLHGVATFGPRAREERAIALGKTALVDNSAGLVRLARREAQVGGHYAEVIREAAAHDVGAPAHLSGPELDAYLDRIGGPDRRPFSEVASAVRFAADPQALLGAARALHQWKKDLTR